MFGIYFYIHFFICLPCLPFIEFLHLGPECAMFEQWLVLSCFCIQSYLEVLSVVYTISMISILFQ